MTRTIKDGKGQPLAIGLKQGESFYANHMVPEGIEELVEVEQMENGSRKVTAKVTVIVGAEGVHGSRRGCKHIRFIRSAREDASGLHFAEAMKWPRLRVALGFAGLPTVIALGGLQSALVYRDEVAVANFAVSGSSGWIILRKDIGNYLEALPPIRDNGVIIKYHFESDESSRSRSICRFVEKPPAQENLSHTHRAYLVEYDEGSRLIKRIVDLYTGREQPARGYGTHYLEVGKRFPPNVLNWERTRA